MREKLIITNNYMPDNIQNKTITIVSKEEAKTKAGTNTQIKLTDQDGIKFSFFKKKKDGELTSPATQFKNMDLDEGSTAEIGYVEEKYAGTDGKERTALKIISFREAKAQPVKTQPQPAKENTYHKEEKETDWDKIAVGKCQTVFLEAYISAGHTFEEAKLQVFQARKLAELVVYGTQQTKEEEPFVPAELPTQQIMEEEVNVADIPF